MTCVIQLVKFTAMKNHTLDLLVQNKPNFVEKCLSISGFADCNTVILADLACEIKSSIPPNISKFSCGKKFDFGSLKLDVKKNNTHVYHHQFHKHLFTTCEQNLVFST